MVSPKVGYDTKESLPKYSDRLAESPFKMPRAWIENSSTNKKFVNGII
jgi:hypothetical protein